MKKTFCLSLVVGILSMNVFAKYEDNNFTTKIDDVTKLSICKKIDALSEETEKLVSIEEKKEGNFKNFEVRACRDSNNYILIEVDKQYRNIIKKKEDLPNCNENKKELVSVHSSNEVLENSVRLREYNFSIKSCTDNNGSIMIFLNEKIFSPIE